MCLHDIVHTWVYIVDSSWVEGPTPPSPPPPIFLTKLIIYCSVGVRSKCSASSCQNSSLHPWSMCACMCVRLCIDCVCICTCTCVHICLHMTCMRVYLIPLNSAIIFYQFFQNWLISGTVSTAIYTEELL